MPNKRPWPNKRPGWKNDSKLINVQGLITVQGGKIIEIDIVFTPCSQQSRLPIEKNSKQKNILKKNLKKQKNKDWKTFLASLLSVVAFLNSIGNTFLVS